MIITQSRQAAKETSTFASCDRSTHDRSFFSSVLDTKWLTTADREIQFSRRVWNIAVDKPGPP